MSDEDRRELERALRFVNDAGSVFTRQAERALDDVNALVELLIAQGTITLKAYERRRALVDRDRDATLDPYRVRLHACEDKYAVEPVRIDCEARLHLCQARCCALPFDLSAQDLDEGVVRWDYAHPYRIRADASGRCVHNDAQTRACSIHAQRPAVCRQYDCRNDPRIWKDFEAKIPA